MRFLVRSSLCFLLFLSGIVESVGPEHVIAVTILKADLAGKTFLARTLDGTEHTYHFSPQAPISSLAEAAMSKSLSGGAGYQFLIHYSIERREQIVIGFDYVGREAWKTATGIIVKKDPLSRIFSMKTENGAEMTFGAGKHCTIETAAGARSFDEWINGAGLPDAEITIRYTEVPAGRLAHLLEIAAPTSS